MGATAARAFLGCAYYDYDFHCYCHCDYYIIEKYAFIHYTYIFFIAFATEHFDEYGFCDDHTFDAIGKSIKEDQRPKDVTTFRACTETRRGWGSWQSASSDSSE